eukprot:9110480-Prorocentrum_lima.AAC.1
MTSSLVGSEMCIRDRDFTPSKIRNIKFVDGKPVSETKTKEEEDAWQNYNCLLYTSDAADDM